MKLSEAVDREIEVLIGSRYPVLYIISWEEKRVEDALFKIASAWKKKLNVWTVTQGITSIDAGYYANDNTKDPLSALDYILKEKEPAIYILKDFHSYLDKPEVIRKMRDVAYYFKKSFCTLVILSPILNIPSELEKEITVMDYPLPDYSHIEEILNKLINTVKKNAKISIKLTDEVKEKIIKAALGLTLSEAENVFAKSIVQNSSLGPEDIQLIISEKEQIIRKSGILDYYHTQEELKDVGGLGFLKEWLFKRSGAFTEKARDFGLPQPKGILLLGVQGCGKSLTAKVISALWNLPLLRLDVGRVFSSMVGTSEGNMRKAIKVSESVSPCILWLDEIEKGFSGVQSSAVSDAGTTARVFATFLTWLQEKTSPVFVVATANDISLLPPEMVRKGRFDEIFFIDLPKPSERGEVFKIHLNKRKRNPVNFEIECLVKNSEGMSGAEIEQAVISSLYDVFAANGKEDIQTEDVLKSLKETIPLSRTMDKEINKLREWAKFRARPAS